MAVPRFLRRAHGFDLVLGRVPVNLKVSLLTVLVEGVIHAMHDLLVRSTLERNQLSEIVETYNRQGSK